MLEILASTRLVELAVERSLLTGMQLDRVGAAIASVDSLYLGALRARGRVAPSVHAPEHARRAIAGGARARLASRALPEHPRLRLQEPVPEHHPHLQHRPADLRAPSDGDGAVDPDAGRRRLPARRARHPARAGGALAAERARPARGGRRGRRAGDQDPDELALRRARLAARRVSSRRRSPTRSRSPAST